MLDNINLRNDHISGRRKFNGVTPKGLGIDFMYQNGMS